MKKFMCIFFVITFSITSKVSAAGYHRPGFVDIYTAYPGTSWEYSAMMGTVNVRYTDDAWDGDSLSGSFIESELFIRSRPRIQFRGMDELGNFFSCNIYHDNPIYAEALGIHNNLTNGAYISLLKMNNPPSECMSFYINKASYHLD